MGCNWARHSEDGIQLVRTFLEKWENFHAQDKTDGLESISRRDSGFSSENRGLVSLSFKEPTENPEQHSNFSWRVIGEQGVIPPVLHVLMRKRSGPKSGTGSVPILAVFWQQ